MLHHSTPYYRLPDDVFMIDLDSNKLIAPQEVPPLPEPEGTILKNHLKQVRWWFVLTNFFQFSHLIYSAFQKGNATNGSSWHRRKYFIIFVLCRDCMWNEMHYRNSKLWQKLYVCLRLEISWNVLVFFLIK